MLKRVPSGSARLLKPSPTMLWYSPCLSVQAANTEDTPAGKEKSKELFKQAIEAFDKAKELDPDKRVSKWGYNRYQAYYGLYGENDPRTKAAEEDSK